MSDLSLSNVFDVSVSAPGASVGVFNTSNLAILSHEVPGASYGNLGYKIYVDPTDVGTDFGTTSTTYKLALSVFSQKPNIRAGGGYLVIFTAVPGSVELAFDAVPATGAAQINIGAGNISLVPADTAASVQTKVRALTGMSKAVVTGDFTLGFDMSFAGVYPVPTVTVGTNTLEDAGTDPVTVTPTTTAAETPAAGLVRADGLVHFFGVILDMELTAFDMDAFADAMSPLRKIAFVLGSDEADMQSGGKLYALQAAKQENTRGLYYGDPDGLEYVAAYAGRGLSVNFQGSNTTITMHLKDLIGITADSTVGQTQLNLAKDAGADIYGSFRGVAKTFTSGKNNYFDNVYNLLWFVEEVQVAGFNVYGTTPTKVPQTEDGMNTLKKAVRVVCEQAVTNGFCAPGEWTSPVTFGPQADFFANIRQRGYYIYSAPIAQQSVAAREARQSPLLQVALKYQGAMHSGTLIININQ